LQNNETEQESDSILQACFTNLLSHAVPQSGFLFNITTIYCNCFVQWLQQTLTSNLNDYNSKTTSDILLILNIIANQILTDIAEKYNVLKNLLS